MPLGGEATACDVVSPTRPRVPMLMLRKVAWLNIPKLQSLGRVLRDLPSSHETTAAARWALLFIDRREKGLALLRMG